MDRRTLLTVSICFMIFLAWQKLYLEPRLPAHGQTQSQPAGAPPMAGQPGAPAGQLSQGQSPATPSKPVESKPVAVGTGTAMVGNGPRFFTGWNLKSYRLGLAPEAAAVDLPSVTHQEEGGGELAFDIPELAYLTQAQGTLTATAEGALWTLDDKNVKLTREFISNGNNPFIDVKITAQFKGKAPGYAFVSLGTQSPPSDPELQDRQLVYWTNQSIERVKMEDNMALKEVGTPVKWVGATSRYFLMTLISQTATEPRALIQPLGPKAARASLVYPVTGNSVTIPLRVYFGPKELELLRSVEPTLDHTVDFGWFTVFAYPLIKIMKWFYGVVHNYGFAIILLTLLVKILTYPLTYKSMKSMKEMAKLQPQLQRIREKYKDDKETLNKEMLTLMRSHGYNPMAGCLPMLIQMPVFFALYRVLYSSIELYHAPFGLWIHDLASKDPLYVTPILLTVTMFLQQKLTPNTATDPAQQKMMQFMPVMFGIFMISLPSGLTIYMLVNALASIAQQMILNRKFDGGHVSAVAARAR